MTEAQAAWAEEQAANIRKSINGLANRSWSCGWIQWIKTELFLEKPSGAPERLDDYFLEKVAFKSPTLDAEGDTACALEAMTSTGAYLIARRYQETFEKVSGRLVICGNHKPIVGPFGHKDTVQGMKTPWHAGALTSEILAGIHCYLAIENCKEDSYGEESGRPVFAFIGGDDTFTSFNSTLAKLFTRKLVPDPPRYRDQDGKLVRVEPLTSDGSYNFEYDDAQFEVAYAFSKAAMSLQAPKPRWVTNERPEECLIDVDWVNMSPGFFLATFASAGVPLRAEQGYTILFCRR